MDFIEFQAARPTQAIFQKLGLMKVLETCSDWDQLRAELLGTGDSDFAQKVRAFYPGASSGEKVLVCAIAAACDYAGLADELQQGRTWRHMSNLDRSFRKVVFGCLEAI